MIVTETMPSNGSYEPAHFNFGSWRGSGIWREREPLSAVADKRIAKQLVTGRIMVDGAHAKVFMNEKRIANAPRVELARGDQITFRFDARDDRPIYIGNIRIAAGGKDLYDKLASDGRVVTRGIFFDVASDRIRPESTPTLEEIGDMLQDYPELRIAIEGHTDSDGDDSYNQELSQRRAEAVRQFLIDTYEIDSGRLQAEGLGESVPVGDNATAEGKQQNRRVELVRLD
jgi:outer membrane protein OmpA-like peptidoglycan-associated protein